MEFLNEIYQSLLNEYTKEQLKNRKKAAKRYAEVVEKIPAIAQLDDSIATLSMETAINALEGDETALDLLRQNIEEIKKEKAELLSLGGYPSDYLDPIYTCPDCKDTGYIENRKCHCFQKALVEELYSQSNIKEQLQTENFQTFSLDYYPDDILDPVTNTTPRENMRQILDTLHQFIEEFDEKHGNLLFYGNTGVGKTFLSHCIAKEILEASHTVVYLTSMELFDILGRYTFHHKQNPSEREAALSYILDCDLLIIDDLGTELTNSFTSSQLYHCIDSRLNREHSTIISTNLSFDDLTTRYTERIFSRLMSSYTLLKVYGKDIRIVKAVETTSL